MLMKTTENNRFLIQFFMFVLFFIIQIEVIKSCNPRARLEDKSLFIAPGGRLTNHSVILWQVLVFSGRLSFPFSTGFPQNRTFKKILFSKLQGATYPPTMKFRLTVQPIKRLAVYEYRSFLYCLAHTHLRTTNQTRIY